MDLLIGQVYQTKGHILGQATTKSLRVLGFETDEETGEELVVVDMAPFSQRDEFQEPIERAFNRREFETSVIRS